MYDVHLLSNPDMGRNTDLLVCELQYLRNTREFIGFNWVQFVCRKEELKVPTHMLQISACHRISSSSSF